jgi:hypothetical protein
MHADEIHAKASEEALTNGVHPAMLEGLCDVGVTKTHRVFSILKGTGKNAHFHIGFTKKGGTNKPFLRWGQKPMRPSGSWLNS